ncbi:M57 family metalloprotease [Terrimonas pollutisoli]|uniref:M57 family metalloprotease n=1 Tax=Terrimonas pollutisoli TaxID=3034147 RepID=UPI0023EE1875|nr:M57 family metalloprotease [Terrimonas sp. H1YJ31]
MKLVKTTTALLCVMSLTVISCKKNVKDVQQEEISRETLTKIYNHGFGTSNVQRTEDGYLVEGDIVLTEEFLNGKPGGTFLRIANNEQYRTNNLVTALPRTIKVALDSKLAAKAGYSAALAEMASRYNAENLQLNFLVVSSGADITFVNANGSYLASAGFPTSSGQPYGQVKVNSRAIGTGSSPTFINYLATILAHEAGHCIGFRHTDYMDRSFSCGGATSNEGASTVGAVHIPGTPTEADSGSWMLACIGSGVNRPFNNNDKTALGYLY